MANLAKSPEVRPIKIGGFELTATGMKVKGRPSFEDYQSAGDFIRRAHQASGWWLVEWIAYGESRPDWADLLSQAIDAGTVNEKTVNQYRYIGRNVPPSNRIDGVPFALHVEVASLPNDEQRQWLEKAKEFGWSTRELRMEIRAAQRPVVLSGQAALKGMYRIIYADPPWQRIEAGPTPSGTSRKAERHYPTMSIAELCKLPVVAHAQPDAALFMWVPAPLLLQFPGPRDVIEAWGFTYKTTAVWDKVLGNFGHYFHVRHEHLVVCTRGSCLPDVPTPQTDSVITIRQSSGHSAKPDEFRKIIEKHWTKGPYLELFGRQPVEGWSVFGSDARKWALDARANAADPG